MSRTCEDVMLVALSERTVFVNQSIGEETNYGTVAVLENKDVEQSNFTMECGHCDYKVKSMKEFCDHMEIHRTTHPEPQVAFSQSSEGNPVDEVVKKKQVRKKVCAKKVITERGHAETLNYQNNFLNFLAKTDQFKAVEDSEKKVIKKLSKAVDVTQPLQDCLAAPSVGGDVHEESVISKCLQNRKTLSFQSHIMACCQCAFVTDRWEVLKSHQICHHPRAQTYVCKVCKHTTFDAIIAKMHYVFFHKNFDFYHVTIDEKMTELCTCLSCGVINTDFVSFLLHHAILHDTEAFINKTISEKLGGYVSPLRMTLDKVRSAIQYAHDLKLLKNMNKQPLNMAKPITKGAKMNKKDTVKKKPAKPKHRDCEEKKEPAVKSKSKISKEKKLTAFSKTVGKNYEVDHELGPEAEFIEFNEELDQMWQEEVKVIKPKRRSGLTAYMMWGKFYRNEILLKDPHMSFTEMSKTLGKIWKSLPQNVRRSWKKKAKRFNARTRTLSGKTVTNTLLMPELPSQVPCSSSTIHSTASDSSPLPHSKKSKRAKKIPKSLQDYYVEPRTLQTSIPDMLPFDEEYKNHETDGNSAPIYMDFVTDVKVSETSGNECAEYFYSDQTGNANDDRTNDDNVNLLIKEEPHESVFMDALHTHDGLVKISDMEDLKLGNPCGNVYLHNTCVTDSENTSCYLNIHLKQEPSDSDHLETFPSDDNSDISKQVNLNIKEEPDDTGYIGAVYIDEIHSHNSELLQQEALNESYKSLTSSYFPPLIFHESDGEESEMAGGTEVEMEVGGSQDIVQPIMIKDCYSISENGSLNEIELSLDGAPPCQNINKSETHAEISEGFPLEYLPVPEELNSDTQFIENGRNSTNTPPLPTSVAVATAYNSEAVVLVTINQESTNPESMEEIEMAEEMRCYVEDNVTLNLVSDSQMNISQPQFSTSTNSDDDSLYFQDGDDAEIGLEHSATSLSNDAKSSGVANEVYYIHNFRLFHMAEKTCFQCSHCQGVVYRQLSRHAQTCTANKRIVKHTAAVNYSCYVCILCSRSNTKFSTLKQHVLEAHSHLFDLKPYECLECKTSFLTETIAAWHAKDAVEMSGKAHIIVINKATLEKQTALAHQRIIRIWKYRDTSQSDSVLW